MFQSWDILQAMGYAFDWKEVYPVMTLSPMRRASFFLCFFRKVKFVFVELMSSKATIRMKSKLAKHWTAGFIQAILERGPILEC